MATWQEIQDRVRSEYALDVDEEAELAITVLRKEGPTTRSQRVMARHYTAWGRDMIEVRSAFARAGDYDPAGLLIDNLQLPLGAIALHEGFLVVVQKAALDDLTVEGVVFLLTRISLLADALEERLGKDRF